MRGHEDVFCLQKSRIDLGFIFKYVQTNTGDLLEF